ncbi:uncharacterized protein LOC100678780 isoform X2 [Nasonia vitripennis]|uniref:HMG box domain-containing protein n=1 Tax=Nasonia vitripennis TaxID=7425 RepID=A0A7M7QJZ1_NASVI|nr:uncharacterized protein LOC100678780 isoform X2 [Nasonia vitripennis]
MNAQYQTEISNEVLCYESNSMKSKSSMNDVQLNNFETDSSLTVTNNELLTPDYTSYDEDSTESDEKFLIPKHDLPLQQQSTENYSNTLIETKTNVFPENCAYTGYRLWSSEMKLEILKKYPHMDVTIMTIRLGEMWTQMSVQNRNNWHERAQRLTEKADSFRKLCVMGNEKRLACFM